MTYFNHSTKAVIPAEFLALGLQDVSHPNSACGSVSHPSFYHIEVFPVYDYFDGECPLMPTHWEAWDSNANESIAMTDTQGMVEVLKKILSE